MKIAVELQDASNVSPAEKGVVRWKTINHPQDYANTFELGYGWKAIFHFWFDLPFVDMEHGGRGRLLSRVVQGADHFSSVQLELCIEHVAP